MPADKQNPFLSSGFRKIKAVAPASAVAASPAITDTPASRVVPRPVAGSIKWAYFFPPTITYWCDVPEVDTAWRTNSTSLPEGESLVFQAFRPGGGSPTSMSLVVESRKQKIPFFFKEAAIKSRAAPLPMPPKSTSTPGCPRTTLLEAGFNFNFSYPQAASACFKSASPGSAPRDRARLHNRDAAPKAGSKAPCDSSAIRQARSKRENNPGLSTISFPASVLFN